jgi:hypothetical protein
MGPIAAQAARCRGGSSSYAASFAGAFSAQKRSYSASAPAWLGLKRYSCARKMNIGSIRIDITQCWINPMRPAPPRVNRSSTSIMIAAFRNGVKP